MSQETKNTTEQDLPVEETAQQPPETGEPVRQPEPAQEPAKEPAKEEKQPSELDSVKQQLAKEHDGYLRLAAEYDNFRKRTEREKAAIYSDATAAAVLEFLPVADNLERALEQQECSVEDLRKGVEMVQTQLKRALEKLGVAEMGVAGEAFNPELHNAVSHIDDESAAENVVAQVYQKGYKIGDKVVRHATVVVAN